MTFLRQQQKNSILLLLNLNNSSEASSLNSPENTLNSHSSALTTWKVLIYDKLGQDIISPILKVNDLRAQGITVHLSITSDRFPINDVPAVYFVEPTAHNITLIAQDISKNLYESYYVNFSSSIPRPLLEEFASICLNSNTSHLVSQIYDQHLNYVCLEDNLFSIQMKDSYFLINDSNSSESLIEDLTSSIVSSLFSVIITMGVIPIIRCPRGTAAEAVALKLDSKLRDYLLNTRNNIQLETTIQLTRPVLVLFDRMMDLSTMLSHTWTYSTLVHDILDMNLNKISIPVEERGQTIRKQYDIDSNDEFWQKNSGNPFPQVAEDVDQEINKYKQDVDKITKACGVNSLEEMDPNEFNSGAKGLSEALEKLPKLTLRKKSLDMHMNIATALFKYIQERKLDTFFSMEESVGKITKASMLEIIRDESRSAEDKIRLFIIFYLANDDISKDELSEFEGALIGSRCDTGMLSYIKQVRMYNKMAVSQQDPKAPASTGKDFLGTFTSIGNTLSGHLQSSGVSSKFEGLISGFKNLLPTRKELPVTRILQSLMDVTYTSPESEDYLYLDPKLPKAVSGKNKNKTNFNDAIVFMIGGGNYLEYQNIMELTAKSTSIQKKQILYGTTELLTAKAFLQQLERLGKTTL